MSSTQTSSRAEDNAGTESRQGLLALVQVFTGPVVMLAGWTAVGFGSRFVWNRAAYRDGSG